MPLPAALLAKLQKRGIVQEEKEEEEVFAENYDDSDEEDSDEDQEPEGRGGAPGCPNKWNQFHSCSDFCYDHWQEGTPESRLDENYLNAKRIMLQKYPLPPGWKEVYDKGVGRHYYWNTESDEVCWLSPRHPCATVGKAAPQVAQEFFQAKQEAILKQQQAEEERQQRKGKSRWADNRYKPEKRKTNPEEVDPESIEEMPERDRLKRAKRKGIDPMDPSAYSDCPEGNWGAGIVSDNKTGADTTASGPLFQSRPYPAPGDVLRKNQ